MKKYNFYVSGKLKCSCYTEDKREEIKVNFKRLKIRYILKVEDL